MNEFRMLEETIEPRRENSPEANWSHSDLFSSSGFSVIDSTPPDFMVWPSIVSVALEERARFIRIFDDLQF